MTVERDGGGVVGELPDPPASAARVGPPTVTVRTVAECDHDSIIEALALARSLRAFGGSQAAVECEVYFVGRLPDDVAPFEALDVTLGVVEALDSRCPHANKLQMLRPVETDYLLAVD